MSFVTEVIEIIRDQRVWNYMLVWDSGLPKETCFRWGCTLPPRVEYH